MTIKNCPRCKIDRNINEFSYNGYNNNNERVKKYDLVAGASVAKLGFTGRIQAAATQILFGFSSGN